MVVHHHDCPNESDVLERVENRIKLLEEAKKNILCAQEKQKRDYNRRHAKPHLFTSGQLVVKKDFKRKKRKGRKLDMKFIGPFTVQIKLNNGVYELISSDGSTLRVTGAHLKPYNNSSPPVSTETQPRSVQQ